MQAYIRLLRDCLWTVIVASLPMASAHAKIQFDEGHRTWSLVSGGVEYRIARPKEAVHLSYFGPAGQRDWPAPGGPWQGAWDPTGVFTRQVLVRNCGQEPLRIEDLPSLAWLLPAGAYDLDYLWGGWGQERQMATERLGPGARSFVTKSGRSTRLFSPWFCLRNGALGIRFLGQLACSGNWQMHFDRPPTQQPLDRDPLLVQFNSWYPFPGKMTVGEMKRCANMAAELGAEVFVLDAGWFNKTNWSAELGDWQADPVAFPNGLKELASHAHGLGMKFGLWLEIENLGLQSQRFKEHPDWCFHYNGQPVLNDQRYQLNYAKPEGWMALQYAAPGKERSVLLAYRLRGSAAEARFNLRGLDAARTYQVRTDGLMKGRSKGAPLNTFAHVYSVS